MTTTADELYMIPKERREYEELEKIQMENVRPKYRMLSTFALAIGKSNIPQLMNES